MWEPLCHDYPSQIICEKVPTTCCHEVNIGKDGYLYPFLDANCECDFYNYAEKILGYIGVSPKVACVKAQGDLKSTVGEDRTALERIYNSTNGVHQLNSSGWLEKKTSHCDWFGITCIDEFVIKINLTDNNLTGTVDQKYDDRGLPLPLELESLILKKNHLSGPPFGGNIFFRYRKLTHVDISKNNFSGATDILAFPAADHLDFSQNNFSSIKKYKRFGRAYEVLRMIDLSNNMIKQDASDIFNNIPPNVEELILSNNKIKGNLPNPFPVLHKMRNLAMNNNNMNGTLPDNPQSLLQLRKLDLSNQSENGGFTGSIPAGLSDKLDLTHLNLANNRLAQNIPPDIGILPKLQALNLSTNELKGSIPSELGKLEGMSFSDT